MGQFLIHSGKTARRDGFDAPSVEAVIAQIGKRLPTDRKLPDEAYTGRHVKFGLYFLFATTGFIEGR